MCISPEIIKRPRDEWQDSNDYSTTTRSVPCGVCHKCLGRRRNAWSFRLYHQSLVSDTACFMTLTYGKDEKRGWGEDPPTSFNGIYTLEKRDLQLFLKRLRKQNNGKIKYYAVGEYGSSFLRPHYHLIMFNLDERLLQRSFDVSKNIWEKGNVDIARCDLGTINYTVGYIMQGKWQPQTDDDDRNPHFSIMSKKLGSSYLTDNVYHYHLDRMETSVIHPSGFRIPLPRYYRDQIFSKEEKAELYDLNRQLNAMDWDEFVNIDRTHNHNTIKHEIEQFKKQQRLKRVTL